MVIANSVHTGADPLRNKYGGIGRNHQFNDSFHRRGDMLAIANVQPVIPILCL